MVWPTLSTLGSWTFDNVLFFTVTVTLNTRQYTQGSATTEKVFVYLHVTVEYDEL